MRVVAVLLLLGCGPVDDGPDETRLATLAFCTEAAQQWCLDATVCNAQPLDNCDVGAVGFDTFLTVCCDMQYGCSRDYTIDATALDICLDQSAQMGCPAIDAGDYPSICRGE